MKTTKYEPYDNVDDVVGVTPRGNWTDGECYYVSIVEGERFALAVGPFQTHQEALDMVSSARDIGRELDPKSHFYSWGTCKMAHGHREGVLNAYLS